MSDCVTSNPQGKSKSCVGIDEKRTNFIIQEFDGTDFTLSTIADVSNWESKFNSGEMYRFTRLNGDAEKVGGDAVTRQNGSDGVTHVMRFNGVSYNAGIETNSCDFAELKRVFKPGRIFKVWEESAGYLYGWEYDNAGVPALKGFTAEVVANQFANAVADENSDFMVMINLTVPKEKDYPYVMAKPNQFEFKAEAAIPVGYTLSKVDVSTLATATVKVSERCGDVVTGIADTAFFKDGVAYGDTEVSESSGQYTLDLTGVSVLQVVVGTAPDITHKSNKLVI